MMTRAESLAGMLEFAIDLAKSAGAITLDYFQSSRLKIDDKADGSPVTEADRGAEQFMRERIADAFPAHAILGEEFGERPGHIGGSPAPRHRWIIDPIDGTKSFIHGVPIYGVMIALEIDGVPAAGVCHFPALGETVAAGRGLGCHFNDVRCTVNQTADLADAIVLASDLAGFAITGRQAGFEELLSKTKYFRTWGDCYGHCLVATGRAEIMLDPRLAEWDAAPLAPILAEAGGRFTGWDGSDSIRAGDGISTNGLLHDQVRTVLTGNAVSS